MRDRALLIECMALLMEYRAFLMEYMAVLIEYTALLMEYRAACISVMQCVWDECVAPERHPSAAKKPRKAPALCLKPD